MNFKKYLDSRGISQYKVAKLAGVSEASISLFISGQRSWNLETAKKVANALEITVDELIRVSEGEHDET